MRAQAEGRVGAETMTMLRRSYAASAGPVLDFTASADAQAAQVEHVAGCKHCRDKHAKAATEEVPPTAHELALRGRLRDSLDASIAQPCANTDAHRDAVTAVKRLHLRPPPVCAFHTHAHTHTHTHTHRHWCKRP
jgi:hypothetical protein